MSKKFPPVKSKDVVRVLLALGYAEVGQSGSHRQFKREDSGKVTVPDHSKELKRGTLKSIMEQIGISKEAFYELV